MGLGIALGVVIGIYSDDLALWIPVGIPLGVAIGGIEQTVTREPPPARRRSPHVLVGLTAFSSG